MVMDQNFHFHRNLRNTVGVRSSLRRTTKTLLRSLFVAVAAEVAAAVEVQSIEVAAVPVEAAMVQLQEATSKPVKERPKRVEVAARRRCRYSRPSRCAFC